MSNSSTTRADDHAVGLVNAGLMRVQIQDALRQWHEKLGYPAAQEGEIHIGADAVLAAISPQAAPTEPMLWRGIPIAEAQNMCEYWLETYPDGNFPEGI